jgi:hypothetical protein
MSKQHARSKAAAGLLFAVVLAGCEMDPLGSRLEASALQAKIAGTVESDYVGNAVFSTLQRGPIGFILDSARSRFADEGFHFYSGSPPEVGTHALGAGAEIRALYSIREGQQTKQFAAEAGELVISASSAERMQGSFHFAAYLQSVSMCVAPAPGSMTCSMTPVEDREQVIEVTGTIDAVARRRPTPMRMM